MCKENVSVIGLDNQRTAYEVEEFLTGIPNVQRAQADIINDTIVVEYDESQLTHDAVLDMIEHAGCQPEDRINGVMDNLRAKIGKL